MTGHNSKWTMRQMFTLFYCMACLLFYFSHFSNALDTVLCCHSLKSNNCIMSCYILMFVSTYSRYFCYYILHTVHILAYSVILMSLHLSPKLRMKIFEGSYLQSSLDDVATSACFLLSGWGDNELVAFASVCSTAEQHNSETRWEWYWETENEWVGWGWTRELWFVFLLCSAWQRTLGRQAVCWGKTRSSFSPADRVLWPFLLFLSGPLFTCVSLSALMSWFALQVFYVVVMSTLVLKLLLYIINDSHWD